MNRKQRRSTKSNKPRDVKPQSLSQQQKNEIFALAVQNHKQGLIQEAKRLYIEMINLDPNSCASYNNLGLIIQSEGNIEEAEKLYKNALFLNRNYVDALNNLGNIENIKGDGNQAIVYYSAALQIDGNSCSSHVNLGNALQGKGRFDEALQHYLKAVNLDPNQVEAYISLGNLFNRSARYGDAIECYERAMALFPNNPSAYNNMGYALRIQSRVARAALIFERGLRIDIDHFDTYVNYGGTHKDVGRVDIGVQCYERALTLNPDSVNAMSNLMFAHNYPDSFDVGMVARRHFEIGRKIQALNPVLPTPPANVPNPERRLRIGYVSPDFRQHAVTFFFEPLLQAHDRNQVQIFLYAELTVQDHVSARMREMADGWVLTVGMTDAELAERIRADGIDILVDLAGHTAHTRLPVFARRPAPIQVTWLGYPNTTGLDTIDYRFVDAITDPEGPADDLAAEKLVRLPGVFLCYRPPEQAPDPVPLPSREAGFITFGSFSTLAKLSPSTLDLWSEILKRVPGSRLLLKSRLFVEETTRDLYRSRLTERGVADDRLLFMEPIADTGQHLATYNKIDIALDPFPYNGTTTTCEALWMGVPMVVLRGNCHAGRVGMSLLTRVGLAGLIADTPERYVEIAAELAADPVRLMELRQGLRERMRGSRLCDAPAFARTMEETYRELWRRWCRGERR